MLLLRAIPFPALAALTGQAGRSKETLADNVGRLAKQLICGVTMNAVSNVPSCIEAGNGADLHA